MRSKHTPGPWKAYEEYPETVEFSNPTDGDFGGLNIRVNGFNYKTGLRVGEDEQAANMRLIAAAPDMLAVLTELLESAVYWSEYEVPIGIVDRIHDAIIKATIEPKWNTPA